MQSAAVWAAVTAAADTIPAVAVAVVGTLLVGVAVVLAVRIVDIEQLVCVRECRVPAVR